MVFVEDLKIGADGTVLVFFNDRTRFEYHSGTRLWREVSPEIEVAAEDANSKFKVTTTSNVKIGTAGLQLSAEEL